MLRSRVGRIARRPTRTYPGRADQVGNHPESISSFLLNHLERVERPREEGIGHFGYHVGGIDETGKVRLFNVFWEPPGTQLATPSAGRYGCCDHSPGSGPSFVFNGRSDIAELPVRALLNEVQNGRETRFNVREPSGVLRFADSAVRFAAAISLDVGLPVRLLLIDRKARSFQWTNRVDRALAREFDRSLRRFLRAGR